MSGGSRDDVGRFTVSCTSIQFLCLIFLVSCPIFVDKCKRQNVLGSPSGELPEGLRGLRSGIACKCWNIDSIGLFNIARYTAGMPLLPSALPPKGEARRYVANDFLNLIALPLRGRCPVGADRAQAV